MRWQWASSTDAYLSGSLLLPSFAIPSEKAGVGPSGWAELGASGTTQVVEGWFEPPLTATYYLMVRTDIVSTLTWSGDASAVAVETLASISTSGLGPELALTGGSKAVAVELWASPAWACECVKAGSHPTPRPLLLPLCQREALPRLQPRLRPPQALPWPHRRPLTSLKQSHPSPPGASAPAPTQ